jgi:hypothetical protein
MARQLPLELEDAFVMMRRTLVAVKAEVRAVGPSFLLAQVIGLQLDLIERLLLEVEGRDSHGSEDC